MQDSPLKVLMSHYEETMGLSGHKLSFFFDGTKLSGKELPADLGMESGDLIEVWGWSFLLLFGCRAKTWGQQLPLLLLLFAPQGLTETELELIYLFISSTGDWTLDCAYAKDISVKWR